MKKNKSFLENLMYKLKYNNKYNAPYIFFKKFTMLFKSLTTDDVRLLLNQSCTISQWAEVDMDEFDEFEYETQLDSFDSYPKELTRDFVLSLNEKHLNWLRDLISNETVERLLSNKLDAVWVDIE